MADDLQQLETWAAPLLAKLQRPARRQLARTIGVELRRAQAKRIASQTAPDGTPYPARKRRAEPLRSKRGSIRRRQQAMFPKLRAARWLKIRTTDDGVEVGFFGRVARLARVHQEGLRDRVAPGGPQVQYARRALIGFSAADRDLARDLLLDHLTT